METFTLTSVLLGLLAAIFLGINILSKLDTIESKKEMIEDKIDETKSLVQQSYSEIEKRIFRVSQEMSGNFVFHLHQIKELLEKNMALTEKTVKRKRIIINRENRTEREVNPGRECIYKPIADCKEILTAARNTLIKSDYMYLGEIARKNKEKIYSINGIGVAGIKSIKDCLENNGLSFEMSLTDEEIKTINELKGKPSE